MLTLATLIAGYQCIVPMDHPGTALDTIPQIGKKVIWSSVKTGEPVQMFSPQYVPNDPIQGYHIPQINLYSAWDHSKGDGVVIAILDTGFQLDHPDLVNQYQLPGRNTVSDNDDVGPVMYHGTAVASCAAAQGDNGIGIVGSAFNARILPIRVSNLSSGDASSTAIVKGILWAADNGADVINISYAAYPLASVQDASAYAASRGANVTFSAGNQGINVYNGDPEDMVIVGALDEGGNRTGFSNVGPSLDVMAGGQGVWTANLGSIYTQRNGTSFPSPIVAGVLACIKSANPSLTPDERMQVLLSTCDDITGPAPATVGWDFVTGWGRANAGRAVELAKSLGGGGGNEGDTESPVINVLRPLAGSMQSGNRMVVDIETSDNVRVVSLTATTPTQSATRTDPGSAVKLNFNLRKIPSGPFTLTVTARDEAGNETVRTVQLVRGGALSP